MGKEISNQKDQRKKSRKYRKQHSTKGALIKGMSQRLPSEILESDIFTEHLKSMMKRYAGIYALYRGKELYYIGLTKDLLGRIHSHKKDRHARKWDSFTIFRIRRVRYLKDIETLITRLIDTPGNKFKGHIQRDADFNKVLHKVLKKHKIAIKELEEVFRKK